MAIFLNYVCAYPNCREELDTIAELQNHVDDVHQPFPNKTSMIGHSVRSVQSLNKNKMNIDSQNNTALMTVPKVNALPKETILASDTNKNKNELPKTSTTRTGGPHIKQAERAPTKSFGQTDGTKMEPKQSTAATGGPIIKQAGRLDKKSITSSTVKTVDFKQVKMNPQVTMAEQSKMQLLKPFVEAPVVAPLSVSVPEQKETKLISHSSLENGEYSTLRTISNDGEKFKLDPQVLTDELNKNENIKLFDSYMDASGVKKKTKLISQSEENKNNCSKFCPWLIIRESILARHKNAYKSYSCPIPGCFKLYENINGIKYHAKTSHGNGPRDPSNIVLRNNKIIKRPIMNSVTPLPLPKRIYEEPEAEIIEEVN